MVGGGEREEAAAPSHERGGLGGARGLPKDWPTKNDDDSSDGAVGGWLPTKKRRRRRHLGGDRSTSQETVVISGDGLEREL